MSPPPAQRRGRLGVQTPCNPYPTLPHASESTTPPSARPQWRARADQPRTGARQAAPQRASQAGFGRRLQQGPCPSERTAAATAHTGRSERARGTGTYWQACSGASGARGAHAPAHAPQQQAAGRAPAPHNTRAVGRARAWRRPRCRPASPRASAARAGPPAGRPGRRRGSRPSRPAPRPRRSTPRRARAAAERRHRAPAPRPPRRAPPPAPHPPALRRARREPWPGPLKLMVLHRRCRPQAALAHKSAAARRLPGWPTRRQAGAHYPQPRAAAGGRGTRAPPSASPG